MGFTSLLYNRVALSETHQEDGEYAAPILLLSLLFIYFSLALQIVHKIINYNMTN